MSTYNFSLIVEGHDLHSGRVLDALYESGYSDALVAITDGVQYLHFDRTAPTIEEAIRSAIADAESVNGIEVVGVDRD